jgi:hypothetical protein
VRRHSLRTTFLIAFARSFVLLPAVVFPRCPSRVKFYGGTVPSIENNSLVSGIHDKNKKKHREIIRRKPQ